MADGDLTPEQYEALFGEPPPRAPWVPEPPVTDDIFPEHRWRPKSPRLTFADIEAPEKPSRIGSVFSTLRKHPIAAAVIAVLAVVLVTNFPSGSSPEPEVTASDDTQVFSVQAVEPVDNSVPPSDDEIDVEVAGTMVERTPGRCVPISDAEMLVDATCVETWPLTVDGGMLMCEAPGVVTFTTDDGDVYAVNGLAESFAAERGWIGDIGPIWLDNPDGPGPKTNIGDLITLARSFAACE